MEENLKTMEEMPENVEEKSEGEKGVVEEKEKTTGEKTENTKEEVQGTEEKAENAKEGVQGTEEKAENANEEVQGAEEKAENTNEGPEDAEEKAENASETENKGAGGISKENWKKIAGYTELAVAFLLAVLSVWLFLNTRGTRLLYVSVATGRVSRYYWGVLLAAIVIGVIGLVTLKNSRKGKGHK